MRKEKERKERRKEGRREEGMEGRKNEGRKGRIEGRRKERRDEKEGEKDKRKGEKDKRRKRVRPEQAVRVYEEKCIWLSSGFGNSPLPFSYYRKRPAKMRNYHRRGWILGLIVLNQSSGAGMQVISRWR